MARVISNHDLGTLFLKATDAFFDYVKTNQAERLIVALPGGRSVVGFLKALLAQSKSLENKHWERLHFFMLDERLVPLTAEESNFRLVNEVFYLGARERGIITEEQLHPFHWNPNIKDQGLVAYQAELRKFGGKFNMVVLGVGEDAHIGALFPQHHSVRNTAQSYFSMDDSPKPPPQRMTASAALIAKAEWGMALFIGEGKREAFRKYFQTSNSIQDVPARMLEQIAHSWVVTDLEMESENE